LNGGVDEERRARAGLEPFAVYEARMRGER
jgi:hypothetical protein